MCDYCEHEYRCGHFRWVAAQWCNHYTRTHRRCKPNIIFWEYRRHEICSNCKKRDAVPWEGMIKRPDPAGDGWTGRDGQWVGLGAYRYFK